MTEHNVLVFLLALSALLAAARLLGELARLLGDGYGLARITSHSGFAQ